MNETSFRSHHNPPITEFVPFPKIPRMAKALHAVVTEKLDGTNASLHIDAELNIRPASRNRFITVEDDNFGFAAWVAANTEELKKLGPGRHYGEWWGLGIGRKYGLTEKRFSLFNVLRWGRDEAHRPACCGVVPILYQGPMDVLAINTAFEGLRANGSTAAPGFMNPEGIVVALPGVGTLFKHTFEHVDGKWLADQPATPQEVTV